ncbi:MAG: hypothetical protein Ct9H300mP1_05550 [Planctomycetaceae bacterium]|nr:MAG: hypothetical protein Ct9H300mP1_05550 [Planctomycetaceae bacterium]
MTVQRSSSRPSIDGRLDDVSWNDRPALDHFATLDYEAGQAGNQTTVHLSYDADHLYIGARCVEPDVSSIVAKRRSRDDPGSLRMIGSRSSSRPKTDRITTWC